ncbi:type 1 glutamine amidotransferase [Aeromicrobium stalagmiti]|uniref:type 1 glutamine amidotransferase n=1 Tax=Aeromicrobium stalagmiti TaxID=2738988 RepID=UPI0015681B5C|nr:gamma-glutamyl-gamma-aminobutyrate hydrolase family protein [Aeromicrobium stalagmiti]NRQ50381.1 gamma-glutamyl-gamma-aminobutyrate hydrolase family protein [Aeromicrobium stalagmiti]
MRIHVVADAADKDGGYVVDRLVERGGEIVELDRDELTPYADLGGTDLVLLLGSDKSAHDEKWTESVTAEIRLVRAALAAGTPVMGICYGAQVMARALGGTSWRADQAELGWARVDTTDHVLCPEGPWGQMHKDVFAPGPTSRVIGTSWRGPQCFVDDAFGARAIAWQFHPEVTPQTYERWVDEAYFGDTGQDPKDLVRQAYAHAPNARNLADKLTDAALDYLGVA